MANEAKTKKVTPKKTTKKAPAKKASVKKTSTTTTAKKATQKKVATNKSTRIVQEENNYKNTIIAAIIIALIFIVGLFAIQNVSNKDEDANYVPTEDEIAFKEEYESLNGTSNTQVEIIKDNNVEYIDMKKASEILESGSGVIYFGYSEDEFARMAIPVLLDAMSSSELNKVFYVNLRPENKEENDVRDLYTLNTKNKAKIAKEATEEYSLVRTSLANHLDDYILLTSKGKKVNTGQKRLNSPTVVSVVEGQILGFHEGTVEGHVINKDDKSPALTKDQTKLLLEEYTAVISSQLNKKCTIEKGC